ncbi:hypothetical protein TNCV_1156461 [Trichonephila clavipes]|nr:hypothetical protein TNCV_1156461 [Trichonephila clavipes]
MSTKLAWGFNTGGLTSQTNHLIGTSAHAPQYLMVTYTGMGTVLETIFIRNRIRCWFNDGMSLSVKRLTHAQSAEEESVAADRRV